MDEKKIYQIIEKLENEIIELKGSKFKNRFRNFFSKSFTKVHWIIGIVIVLIASSLIVYATQITFTDGTVISASEVNSNFTELYDKSSNYSVHVTNDVQQSAPTSNTIVTFNTEIFDNGDFHSTTTNPERLTAPVDGIYLINARLAFTSTNFDRQIVIWLNETDQIGQFAAYADENLYLNAMTIYHLSASDYVTLDAVQTSGTSQTIDGSDARLEFSMVRLASD